MVYRQVALVLATIHYFHHSCTYSCCSCLRDYTEVWESILHWILLFQRHHSSTRLTGTRVPANLGMTHSIGSVRLRSFGTPNVLGRSPEHLRDSGSITCFNEQDADDRDWRVLGIVTCLSKVSVLRVWLVFFSLNEPTKNIFRRFFLSPATIADVACNVFTTREAVHWWWAMVTSSNWL